MKQEELIKEIQRLPPQRQREILEMIGGRAKANHRHEETIQDSENGQRTLSQSLYGILYFEGGPPTDEDVKDMIGDYLLKKYQ